MKISLAVVLFATRKAKVGVLVGITAFLAATSILFVKTSTGSPKLFEVANVKESHSRQAEYSSFVIAVRQAEQVLSGIRNTLQLGHLFRDVNAVLVEPFVVKTRIFGLPNFPPRDGQHPGQAYPLSKVLEFSQISRECSDIQEPLSFETFLQKSARDIVLLHPVRKMDSNRGGFIFQSLFSNESDTSELLKCIDTDSRVCDCRHIIAPFAANLEANLNSGTEDSFSVVRVICFDANKPMTLSSLLKQSGTPYHNDSQPVSYIFTLWYGSSCKKTLPFGKLGTGEQTAASLDSFDQEIATSLDRSDGSRTDWKNGYKCTNSDRVHLVPTVAFPKKCSTTSKTFTSAQFISSHVKELASAFVNSQDLDNVSKFVSIHFRTEWLYVLSKRSRSSKNLKNCCMDELSKLLSKISQELSFHKNSMFVTDMGPHGSDSCNTECRKFTVPLIHQMDREHHIQAVYFEPKAYGMAGDSFAAGLVEQVALAQGRYLVLIGGGKFQMSIVSNALLTGRLEKVYSVCSASTESSEGYPSTVQHISLNSCL